jgi:hypothetical protein
MDGGINRKREVGIDGRIEIRRIPTEEWNKGMRNFTIFCLC